MNASRVERSRAGQAGTEYMLMISVLVIAAVAAAYVFIPTFSGGVSRLAQSVSTILDTGLIGGVGVSHGGSGLPATTRSDPNSSAMVGGPHFPSTAPFSGAAGPLGAPQAPSPFFSPAVSNAAEGSHWISRPVSPLGKVLNAEGKASLDRSRRWPGFASGSAAR